MLRATSYPNIFKRIHLHVYGVVVSMFDFHRSDRGSYPGRGDESHNDNHYIIVASTQRVILLRSANGYQLNYWVQIVETQGNGVAPSPTIW